MPIADGGHDVRIGGPLSPGDSAEVLALAQRAAEDDGVSPLSEHVMLHLRYGGDRLARNVLLWSGGRLAGYGHLDPTDPVEGPAGEMVVDPAARGQGHGLRLLRALLAEAGANGLPAEAGTTGLPAEAGTTGLPAEAGTTGLRLWAHGDLPSAAGLAASAGLHRSRALWQMRRSLQTRIDRPELADGISVRSFVVGRDEDAWIAVNRSAFSRHPEQGAWTRDDLDMREREPWFDPDGFFLAERAGQVIGFHWTKIHGSAGQADAHGHEPMGEVYVVGVHPSARGTGLGRALTLIGLRYLRGRGLSQVMLYVDETNTAAIRLYESLGFTHWDTDVMFSTHAPDS